ncbi:helix-turn-helix domain-containing protein [Pendulispora albinea]|uniref:Helix-turn-helix domain-containing protein n=1 Tax=Pendulispora albinea TaxID=2741071 RepID=A0ABZ2M0A5_9BACT
MLDGPTDLSVGGREIALAAGGSSDRRIATAVMFSMAEGDTVVRRLRQGVHLRHFVVIAGREWLAASGLDSDTVPPAVRAFQREHLALRRWRLSEQIVFLTEQLLAPPIYGPPVHHLLLESKAIELFADGLRTIAGGEIGPGHGNLDPRAFQRIRAVKERLDASGGMPSSLAAVAKQAGMNVAALQQHFRAAFGSTVFGYLRERNLQRARQALEHGLTVSEAAFEAGYRSPANFATAFKRRFGQTPKRFRS